VYAQIVICAMAQPLPFSQRSQTQKIANLSGCSATLD
jgi:hypothetical protein